MLPAEEVIAGALFGLQHIESRKGLAHILLILGLIHEAAATFTVNFYHGVCN